MELKETTNRTICVIDTRFKSVYENWKEFVDEYWDLELDKTFPFNYDIQKDMNGQYSLNIHFVNLNNGKATSHATINNVTEADMNQVYSYLSTYKNAIMKAWDDVPDSIIVYNSPEIKEDISIVRLVNGIKKVFPLTNEEIAAINKVSDENSDIEDAINMVEACTDYSIDASQLTLEQKQLLIKINSAFMGSIMEDAGVSQNATIDSHIEELESLFPGLTVQL